MWLSSEAAPNTRGLSPLGFPTSPSPALTLRGDTHSGRRSKRKKSPSSGKGPGGAQPASRSQGTLGCHLACPRQPGSFLQMPREPPEQVCTPCSSSPAPPPRSRRRRAAVRSHIFGAQEGEGGLEVAAVPTSFCFPTVTRAFTLSR